MLKDFLMLRMLTVQIRGFSFWKSAVDAAILKIRWYFVPSTIIRKAIKDDPDRLHLPKVRSTTRVRYNTSSELFGNSGDSLCLNFSLPLSGEVLHGDRDT